MAFGYGRGVMCHAPLLTSSSLLLLLVLAACSSPPLSPGDGSDDGAPPRPPLQAGQWEERQGEHRHLLLRYSPQGVTLVESEKLNLPLPRTRVAPTGPWRLVVEGEDGAVLYETRLDAPNLVRGEFADEEGNLKSVAILRDETTFAVRLPTLPEAARIRVYARADTLGGEDSRALRVGGSTELEIGVIDAAGALR